MARNAIIYASLDVRPKVHNSQLQQGEVRTYTLDLNQPANKESTSYTSSSWETPYSSSATLASQAISSNVATVVLTAAQIGRVFLKNTSTATNGTKLIQWFNIWIGNQGAITS